MKLISEFVNQPVELLTETKDGQKKYYIEGVFAQSEKKNRNGRIYPRGVMESAVGKYIEEQVAQGRAVGELNHPEGPTVNLDKVSHLITRLEWKGDDVIGKASILDTPNGNIVKSLLDGGVKLGVSTRGMGSLEQREGTMMVKNDYFMNAIDIVQDPSAQSAFVNGIMEGIEWSFRDGKLTAQTIEELETEIVPQYHAADLGDRQIREFKDFLSDIKRQI